ncbi:transporter substrate-binding domain-containing protein [Thalassomonas viridans]|uniref:Transporter substrate-binding domain-containing protein n=1 Tax=Thalassomonas viridans TaxID=137584 RepID=A0AAF0CBX5_9GAMM|nr:transporter substrate-binding domain-containing protein [Thalassomonas viridans]WDE06944.1 transporter substrate-binding domain-containing protein [Thalassomonas viridans]
MYYRASFSACCLLLLSLPLAAETLIVTLFTGEVPPYIMKKQGKRQGITIDLFALLAKHTGHKFILHEAPVARAMREFDLGRIDIEPGVTPAWRKHRPVPGLYSIVYEDAIDVIVFMGKNRFKVNEVSDLYGKTIGVVRGYSYPGFDQAFAEGKIKKVENSIEEHLLKQLAFGRIDQIFLGYRTALYFKKQGGIYKDLAIGDVVGRNSISLRVHPSKAYLLPGINAALQKMLDSGEVQAIFDKYQ